MTDLLCSKQHQSSRHRAPTKGIVHLRHGNAHTGFHPALAPVGVLLAIGGYVLGTAAALGCAFLLSIVHDLMFVG